MLWLKSIGVGLAAVLVFTLLFVIGSAVSVHLRPAGMASFSLSLLWLALIIVFLVGFGWEFRRLGH